MNAETKEMVAAIKKANRKKENSLQILVQDSDLYDWLPGVFMTLMVIVLGRRTNPKAWIQPDCPKTAEEALGWCDMAQWRIAQRAKKSESQVQRDIARFEKDGVINVDRWMDDNGKNHSMYWVNEAVVKEHQRPSQTADVKRPPRYKEKRKPNSKSFTTRNQPKRVSPEVAEMDEYDEVGA